MKSENGEHESASYVFFFFKPPPEKKTRWEEVNEEDGTFTRASAFGQIVVIL